MKQNKFYHWKYRTDQSSTDLKSILCCLHWWEQIVSDLGSNVNSRSFDDRSNY